MKFTQKNYYLLLNLFFFACPKKNSRYRYAHRDVPQKKTPAINDSLIAGSSYVEQQYIVISASVILFLASKLFQPQ